MTSQFPAMHQLSTLNREISNLNQQLVPVKDEFIAERIGVLLESGLAFPSNMDPAKAIPIYCFALSGVPQIGLQRATEALIKGEVTGMPLRLIPVPPELANLSRTMAKTLTDQRVRAHETRQTLEGNRKAAENGPKTPEQVERVRALRETFKRQHEAKKAQMGGVVHETMDEDKAEYWRKIQSLQDASQLDADQLAFRRKVEHDLSSIAQAEAAASSDQKLADIEF